MRENLNQFLENVRVKRPVIAEVFDVGPVLRLELLFEVRSRNDRRQTQIVAIVRSEPEHCLSRMVRDIIVAIIAIKLEIYFHIIC